MSGDKQELIEKHKARLGYDSTEPWKWGMEGQQSGYSCLCGCGLTTEDMKEDNKI